jgi:hypothetical protein
MIICATGSAPPAVQGFRFDGKWLTATVTVALVAKDTGSVVVVTELEVVEEAACDVAEEALKESEAAVPHAVAATARSPRTPSLRPVLLSSTEVRR